MIDKLIREYEPKDFDGNDEEFITLLKLCAVKRKKVNETTEQCFQRFVLESKRFLKIYKKRGGMHLITISI